MARNQIRVYVAASLDGFIAGPGGDLSWLPAPGAEDPEAQGADAPEPGAVTFEGFLESVGSVLMGRTTYDAVRSFGVPWPYGTRPVFVATHRALDSDPPPTVQAVRGTIDDLVRIARDAAGSDAVYLDGGSLIGRAAEAGLIDDLIVTIAPVVLGAGHPLFAGLATRYHLEILSHHRFVGSLLQLHMVPVAP